MGAEATAPAALTPTQIADILAKHAAWLQGGVSGAMAYLGNAYLGGANLRNAYLRNANLGGANLGGADLGGANLRNANLGGANLRDAYLGGANLGGANLRNAYLGGANLGGANLRNATGDGLYIKSVQGGLWSIAYTADVMQIGCQRHAIADWWGFDDRAIVAMDRRALKWWRDWKPIMQAIIAASPAAPTGYVEPAEPATVPA